jgi:hypothetical protein
MTIGEGSVSPILEKRPESVNWQLMDFKPRKLKLHCGATEFRNG